MDKTELYAVIVLLLIVLAFVVFSPQTYDSEHLSEYLNHYSDAEIVSVLRQDRGGLDGISSAQDIVAEYVEDCSFDELFDAVMDEAIGSGKFEDFILYERADLVKDLIIDHDMLYDWYEKIHGGESVFENHSIEDILSDIRDSYLEYDFLVLLLDDAIQSGTIDVILEEGLSDYVMEYHRESFQEDLSSALYAFWDRVPPQEGSRVYNLWAFIDEVYTDYR